MKKLPSLLVGAVVLVIIGAAVGNMGHPSLAHAGFLGDLWQRYVASWNPFGEKSAPASSTQEGASNGNAASVDLYKPALDYEKAVIMAVKKASPAVVAITISKNVPILENCPVDPFADLPPDMQQFFGDGFNFPMQGQCERGSKLQEIGGGSGFIVSADGLIVTNKHVVADTKASYTVLTNDGKKYDATVLARDPVQDIALVKITASGLPVLDLGDSEALELGQTAIAIGNALAEFRNTVSVGVISGLSRTVTASGDNYGEETIRGVVQTDAAVNPGNSGGPLLNLRGEVVGINTAIVSGAENIGFAIPINQAKRAIASVKATGEIQTPYLGVRYVMLTPDIAKKQKLSLESGALLRGTEDGPAVEPNSPAAKAGLMAEDIITALNGKTIDEEHPLVNAIGEHNVGDTVTFTVVRSGKTLTLTAMLVKRPAE
ncbi:MAG: hypothetical protein RL681_605 [Candidatus Parcubacteria bacterium]|jgi:S1-C subfamily serine protease